MRSTVQLHGLLVSATSDSEGQLQLALPDGMDIAGLIAFLEEELASSFFDPRALMATVDGTLAPLHQVLRDGDSVGLFHTFSGG